VQDLDNVTYEPPPHHTIKPQSPQDPLKPSRTVIVIDHVQEESGLVGRVTPGSKLTSINDHMFNDCSFDVRHSHTCSKLLNMNFYRETSILLLQSHQTQTLSKESESGTYTADSN
jgi:hypothetical protein